MTHANHYCGIFTLALAILLGTPLSGNAQATPAGTPCPPTDHYLLCEGSFALCDNATCTPIPNQAGEQGSASTTPDTALCECTVLYGQNVGPAPSKANWEKKPEGWKKEHPWKKLSHDEICGLRELSDRLLISTYSFALGASHRKMTCPSGPHTTCYGYPCEVDQDDPTKAHCTCPINYAGEFVTMGGDCRQEQCTAVLRQGGFPISSTCLNRALAEQIGLSESPVNQCPAGGM